MTPWAANILVVACAAALASGCPGAAAPRSATFGAKATQAAAAQDAPAPVLDGMLEGELELTLRFDVDFEHGCSQSMEGRGAEGRLVLAVDGSDTATLTLELNESSVMGPSLGKYQAGGGDFIHQSWDELTVWKGRAKRSGKKLTLMFSEVSAARAANPQYGKAELPKPTTSPCSLGLRCSTGTVPAYPSAGKGSMVTLVEEGLVATEVPVLLCEGLGESLDWWGPDLLAADGAMPFGPGDGIVVGAWTFYYNRDVVIRLGP